MKMSNFQLIFTGIFIFFIIAGVLGFSFYSGNKSAVGNVTIWGTYDETIMNKVLQTLRSKDKTFQNVSYYQKDAATYERDLVNAMASGAGPDLFMISQDEVGTFVDKVQTIPFNAVSQSTIVNSYIDEAQVFMTDKGTLALPILTDPLVSYWNKDMLSSAGFAQPPQYWSDLFDMVPHITQTDTNANIKKSGVALGSWNNVRYAKEILSALFLQAGDPIVGRSAATGNQTIVFGGTPAGATENPAASAVKFFTEFVNPSKTSYTWNRSLPNSKDAFASGDLALYFGFASDFKGIVDQNPNLRFGVALLPQIKGSSTHLTFGRMTGLTISRTAANASGALVVAQALTSQSVIAILSQESGLPPVRRDVSVDTSSSAAAAVFAQSALISRGWLDPNSAATEGIFKTMVDSVVSGTSQPDSAVLNAADSLRTLVQNQ